MSFYHLEITSPYRSVFKGKVQSVTFRAFDGEMSVLAGHEPMVTPLQTGIVEYMTDSGVRKRLFHSEGIVTIALDVIILVDSAEYPEEIDIERAEAAGRRARARLAGGTDNFSVVRAKSALLRSDFRLKVAKTLAV